MTTNLERGKLQGMGVRRLVRINRVEEGGSQMRIGGIMPMRIYCRPVVALVPGTYSYARTSDQSEVGPDGAIKVP
jgi:hypothetical protein